MKNQRYLSQNLLTYLGDEFLKFLRILGRIDVCKAFHFSRIMIGRIEESKEFSLFTEIVKQSSLCERKLLLKNFIEDLLVNL